MDHDEAITEVLPFKPETFLGSQSAVEQDRCYVSKDIGIRPPRTLAALYGTGALEGCLLGLLDVVTHLAGSIEVGGFFLM